MNKNCNGNNNTDKSINNNDNDNNNITFLILVSKFFYIMYEIIQTNISFYWTWKFVPHQCMTDSSASC